MNSLVIKPMTTLLTLRTTRMPTFLFELDTHNPLDDVLVRMTFDLIERIVLRACLKQGQVGVPSVI